MASRQRYRPCGCGKLCRGWSCGVSVLVDESALLRCSIGGRVDEANAVAAAFDELAETI